MTDPSRDSNRIKLASASGMTPMDFQSQVMRDDTRLSEFRIDAAEHVASSVPPGSNVIVGEATSLKRRLR